MGVTWVPRAACGLVDPDPHRLSARTDPILGITKHHTGGNAPRDAADSRRTWRALQEQAMSGQNVNHVQYGDIEYNIGFDDFGQLLVGRPNNVVGAHATATGNVANRMTLGAAYLGIGDPSSLALEALAVYYFVAGHVIGHAPLSFAHRDWVRYGGIATACPGDLLAHSRP